MKVLYFNVEGLSKLKYDDSFNEYIKSFQILAFAETFCYGDIDFPGFRIVSNRLAEKPAIRRRNGQSFPLPIDSGKGRPSGGLIVYVRDDFPVSMSEVTVEERCHNIVFCEVGKWAIGFLYLPPQSSNHEIFGWDDILEDNLIELMAKYEDNIIVLGDFNARTGALNDSRNEFEDKYHNITYPSETASDKPRASMDKNTNAFGSKLVQLCRVTNFGIMNGRTEDDNNGAFTFSGHQGASVIDYALSNLVNLDCVKLRVGDWNRHTSHSN